MDSPHEIADQYERLWRAQLENPTRFYNEIRSEFNRTHQPHYLLYLLARCVKASVRYNSKGEFNQGPDKRRLGMKPAMMRQQILGVSALLAGKVEFRHEDFRSIIDECTSQDVVYLDPPYQGTNSGSGRRYVSSVRPEDVISGVRQLVQKGAITILSYDGATGDRRYGRTIESETGLVRLEIEVGPSAQSTLLGRREITKEALYVSPFLIKSPS